VYKRQIIDRGTRWPEAIPIPNVSSETIVRAFLERWVASHGCPATITTDRGPQFESSHFSEFLNILGCHRLRTTAYHPQANGMVERFHRQLKSAINAVDSIHWTDALPMILLGIRASLKADLQVSSAELLYGQPLRLPGDYFSLGPDTCVYDASFARQLATKMRRLRPTDTRAQGRKVFIPQDLNSCTHVFVRVDGTKKPLERPYEGPFKVLQRRDKCYIIDRLGRRDTVSIDRLKPAYLDTSGISEGSPTAFMAPTSLPTAVPAVPPVVSTPVVASPPDTTTTTSRPPVTTRSGRRVHWPRRFTDP
jgi:hypothetical protein